MSGSSTILIADDEPQNLAALRQILTDYRLVFARTGEEAVAAVGKHRPSLILLDVMMPGLDGYAACRAIKADPTSRDIPIIFITSLCNVGDEAKGFEAGGVDYIVKPVQPSVVRARVATHLSLVRSSLPQRSYQDAVYMLGAAGHYNDTDTGVHIWRIAGYARELATLAGWNAQDCELLEQAAPLHDTGKIGIPSTILRKPGKLTPEEWAVMQTHARIGYEILSRSDAPLFRLAAEIALRHHEKWAGGGYPDDLAGEAIPESARIVAVADVFDALSMKRPYKEAWPLHRILETVQAGSGNHFEPRLVDLFMGNLPRFLEIKTRWDDKEARQAAV